MNAIVTEPPSKIGLELPYCAECAQWRIAAREFCAVHPDTPLTTRRLSGRGEIYSFEVNHVAMSPSLAELVPYTVVLVSADEGLRFLAHLEPGSTARIGARVVVREAPEADRARLPGGGPRVARIEEESS